MYLGFSKLQPVKIKDTIEIRKIKFDFFKEIPPKILLHKIILFLK